MYMNINMQYENSIGKMQPKPLISIVDKNHIILIINS